MSINPLSASPLPLSQPSPQVRAPRRCSVCRQPGHNASSCPQNCGVCYQGIVFKQYPTAQQNLTHFTYNWLLQKKPSLNAYPSLLTRILSDISFYVSIMMQHQLKSNLKNPFPMLQWVVTRLTVMVEEWNSARTRQIVSNPTPLQLGKYYAKRITVVNGPTQILNTECFICSENMCNLKTGCGHEFCAECITKIINVNKLKTTPPVCSFCKAPFQKFIVSDVKVTATLGNFLHHL
jgi:hypothetical protein